MRHPDGNPVAPHAAGGFTGGPRLSGSSLIYIMGGTEALPFFFFFFKLPGYVSCEQVVSSRVLEAKSLFEGDFKRKGWKGKTSSGSISFCHLTSRLNWRGLALVQSTADAKRDGIWKRTKRERLSSFVPHGHYLYRQRVISISKYSGLSSSSYYWTFLPLFSWRLS